MQDKDHDPIFDDEKNDHTGEQQLLSMLDQYGKGGGPELRPGAKVKGRVRNVADGCVYVELGGKSDGVLKAVELTRPDGTLSVKEGDAVEAYIASVAGDSVTLSMSFAGVSAGGGELREAMQNKIPVQGKVTGINKGGLQVKVLGVAAFCPASQVEIKYIEDLNGYLNRTLSFIITRVDEGGRKVVLSRIPLLEQDLSDQLDALQKDVAAKRVRSGTVTRIAEFGLFIDTGTGVDGLAHISEVSWARADNLTESFSVGQPVEYVVLGVERRQPLRNTKIALSLKHAAKDPWLSVGGRFAPGTSVEGVITRCAAFGAFVQLVPGVEGLIHISEMSWQKRVSRAEDVVKPGQSVRVTVLALDVNARKVSCSLKDVNDDPWKDAAQRYPVGSSVKGTVASVQKYGYFIDLASGITGLLAMPNIAPDKKSGIKVGAELEVTVAAVDEQKRRMSLSLGVEAAKAEAAAVEQFMQQQASAPAPVVKAGPSEFGDALKAALAKKK